MAKKVKKIKKVKKVKKVKKKVRKGRGCAHGDRRSNGRHRAFGQAERGTQANQSRRSEDRGIGTQHRGDGCCCRGSGRADSHACAEQCCV